MSPNALRAYRSTLWFASGQGIHLLTPREWAASRAWWLSREETGS